MPCVRQLGIGDLDGVAQIQSRVEVQINLNDTVATMNRMEVADDGVVVGVLCTLVINGSTLSAGVQVYEVSVLRSRPNGEAQGEDRIHLLASCRPNGIHIRTTGPDVLATPQDGVAFTSREFGRILVGMRGSRYDGHFQFIDTVAALCRGVHIAVNTVGEDIESVPVQYLALRQITVLVAVERSRFVQVHANDRVTTLRRNQCIRYNG